MSDILLLPPVNMIDISLGLRPRLISIILPVGYQEYIQYINFASAHLMMRPIKGRNLISQSRCS